MLYYVEEMTGADLIRRKGCKIFGYADVEGNSYALSTFDYCEPETWEGIRCFIVGSSKKDREHSVVIPLDAKVFVMERQ